MPGRGYSAGNVYRYGFNGKENDNEVKGTGNLQDYGMRIYDPRIGRFLSSDPLSYQYPELTVYQFSSNNPIEGVDIDGLEYVSSEDVRIEVVRGEVKLKVENMTWVVRNSLKRYCNDPKNWQPGQLGVSLTIGSIKWTKVAPQTDAGSDTDPSDAYSQETLPPGDIRVATENAKSTGLPDKRFKRDRTASGAFPAASRGFAVAAVATEAISYGAKWYFQNRVKRDKNKIESHVSYFMKAVQDVQTALQEGLIPEKYRTEEFISDIINVVLSGQSYIETSEQLSKANNWVSTYEKGTGASIRAIGIDVYNKVSMRRYKYRIGDVQAVKVGETVLNIPSILPNPIYDPNYGAEKKEK